jgi:hypothetical protein
MRCLIVDDEPLAQQVRKNLPAGSPSWRWLENAAARKLLRPCGAVYRSYFPGYSNARLTGLDFINSLHNPPQFILVTAYSEYALALTSMPPITS